jgi:hypothetical protein
MYMMVLYALMESNRIEMGNKRLNRYYLKDGQ